MCRAERAGDRGDDVCGALGVERALLLEQVLRVLTVHVAHRDPEDALLLACLVDRDDVRVVERRGQARLTRKALTERLILAQLRSEKLDRDRTAEGQMLCPVDDAHAAVTEERVQPVARELGANPRNPAHRTLLTGRLGHYHCPRRLSDRVVRALIRRWAPPTGLRLMRAATPPRIARADAVRAAPPDRDRRLHGHATQPVRHPRARRGRRPRASQRRRARHRRRRALTGRLAASPGHPQRDDRPAHALRPHEHHRRRVRRAAAPDAGAEPGWRLQAFADLEDSIRAGMERVARARSCPTATTCAASPSTSTPESCGRSSSGGLLKPPLARVTFVSNAVGGLR